MVRVLGINGSTRTHGRTAFFLEAVLDAARAAGARTERVDLVRLNLPYCAANYSEDPASCGPERCVRGEFDDWGRLSQRILEADALVFATPVYWFAPSARMKTLIERMTSLENKGLLLAGKPFALVAAAEEDGAAQALAQLAVTLGFMGLALTPLGLVYHHSRQSPKPEDDIEALADATRAGRNLVELARRLRGYDWGAGPEKIPQESVEGAG